MAVLSQPCVMLQGSPHLRADGGEVSLAGRQLLRGACGSSRSGGSLGLVRLGGAHGGLRRARLHVRQRGGQRLRLQLRLVQLACAQGGARYSAVYKHKAATDLSPVTHAHATGCIGSAANAPNTCRMQQRGCNLLC